MIRGRHNLSVRARALSATVALLFVFAAAPLALALQGSGTWAMTCCLRESQCCCRSKRTSANPDLGRNVRGRDADLRTSCPQGCAAAIRSSNLYKGQLRNSADDHLLEGQPAPFSDLALQICSSIRLSSASPRAPPASSKVWNL